MAQLQSSIVLDNVSNLLNSNEVSGLFDKLPIKMNDSPLNHSISKEEILNKMQDQANNRNLMPGELWDKFR